MSEEVEEEQAGRKAGQIVFALCFVLIALLLVVMLPDQTVWKNRTKFFAQPRFWPAVGVIGMLVFGGLHLWMRPRHRSRRYLNRYDLREAGVWLASLEYAVWFLVYVWLVPIIGYLPATLIFAPLLSWRLGYHSRKMLWISVLFGVAVVVMFKGFLDVKIPGGLIYEYLPDELRSFFILNF